MARVASVAATQEERLRRFDGDPRFENPRRTGTITALDLKVADHGYLADIGPRLLKFFQARDLVLRPLGNTIYVLPPYCATAADLDCIYDAIEAAAEALA
jgi:adenosylmethionine-8-amino-7-oxononanoate aminotransferase